MSKPDILSYPPTREEQGEQIKPNKCIECEYLLYIKMDDYGGTYARCKIKTPPKAGKIIDWCCTTISPFENGHERLKKSMEKRKVPKWCPLKAGD